MCDINIEINIDTMTYLTNMTTTTNDTTEMELKLGT